MKEGALTPEEIKALFSDSETAPGEDQIDRKIELGLELKLELSVRLGSTRRSIKELLNLQAGTVIELDRLVQEPADILVNGKLIARGEIVAMGEHFGVRVTSIEKPEHRVNLVR
ncbi:MAG TPA: flagellar motor switch protein FliN [Bacillota bacterium]|jgi:flagellar motor switch protein FliN/FliY|nr:flagellar motor switch protein FliN [Bacillota bacterium]HOB86516.1 flagellar motor switch protein FliN [Bacillota bacterium]HOP68893.1 flagellar motor switch protein FliN [Bacillota bacterium]HPT33400.1 flagellar motor switch protein FliN [Bacillota bacterium]HPZ65411.1 flagellar motor switch protein FliN [Bacillota bacterium]